MNRFAALDSDNEEETQQKKVAEKKVVKKTESAQPAAATAAPKKTENKPKTEGKNEKSDKPRPKKERAPKTDAAPAESSAGAEVVEASKENQVRKKNFNKAPKSRYEKKQDDPSNPMIKPDNRIRGSAHANQHRHPSKHSKDAVEHAAKDAEKHPEDELAEPAAEEVVEEVEKIEEPVVEEEPEPPKLGLDDFLRQREEARANSAILNSVKTARAVNDLSGLKIKEGDDLPSVYAGSSKQSKAAKDASQRSKVKTVVNDLSFKVDVAPVVSEDRRNQQRGNGRNYKEQKPRGPRVDLSDASAFPSL